MEKNKYLICLIITISVISGLFCEDNDEFYSDRIIVGFSAGFVGNTRGEFDIQIEDGFVYTPVLWFNDIAREYQITSMERKYIVRDQEWNLDGLYLMNIFRLKIDTSDRKDSLINDLLSNYDVLFAEQEPITMVFDNEQISTISTQEYLQLIQAPEAWTIETGSPDVVVGIVDTGVKWNNGDFAENMWINYENSPNNTIDWDAREILGPYGSDGSQNPTNWDAHFWGDIMGWDFYSDQTGGQDNNPYQDGSGNTQGTMVAGIIAAVYDPSIDRVGVAHTSKIFTTKHIAYNSGSNNLNNAFQGILYLADRGIRIINTSWAIASPNASHLNATMQYAYDKGALIIAAAGNNSNTSVSFPAAHQHAVAVAATTNQDTKWVLSNYGSLIDISAPGDQIMTSSFWGNGDSHGTLTGTAASAAVVSGVAALILSQNLDMTVDELRNILLESVDDVQGQYANQMGSGRVNAYKGVQSVTVDLIAQSLTGSSGTVDLEELTYNVSVINEGNTTASSYTIKLMSGLSELVSVTGPPIAPYAIEIIQITWTPPRFGSYQLYGHVEFLYDQDHSNNTTNVLNVNVTSHIN
ncbi:MAG: S8 family serine peptidase, partial [Candidatus Cloacimonetes bacterium]|nr:S8 family serine peptidase [Candidatus Cloacimonadota bacterium]